MPEPTVSVIIPSLKGGERGPIARDVQGQTVQAQEVQLVVGVSPSGRARNVGARRASGDVLVFLDDDVRLGHERVLEAMVALLDDDGVGMVGAAQLLPADSTAFQRAAGRQIARSRSPVVSVVTDSDMVTTACCAVRRSTFWELGGFNEQIPRGVDPEMRARVRRRGLRIVVAPRAWFYHPMPDGLLTLCGVFFRNGWQSAEAAKQMPSAALDTPDGHAGAPAVARSPVYRWRRHAVRAVCDLARLRWVALASQLAYAAGFAGYHARLRLTGGWSAAGLGKAPKP